MASASPSATPRGHALLASNLYGIVLNAPFNKSAGIRIYRRAHQLIPHVLGPIVATMCGINMTPNR